MDIWDIWLSKHIKRLYRKWETKYKYKYLIRSLEDVVCRIMVQVTINRSVVL